MADNGSVYEDREAAARARMVSDQIHGRGVSDPRVLEAMRRVPRHLFVPPEYRPEAYDDHPVAIGYGQTISQPYIVGFMLHALQLEPGHRVLEIGTGSGYQTALLAELVAAVYSLEVVAPLADRARETLTALNYHNVTIRVGDGHAGWPEHAPYDRIVGAAAPEAVPPALLEELTDGGIIALPIGVVNQDLIVYRRTGDRLETLATMPVRFVPMIRTRS
jgi:protein-L-isoaspartate(D-aspartate) O-methyltransferase